MNLNFLKSVLEIVQKISGISKIAITVLETILDADINGDGKVGNKTVDKKTVKF